MDVPFVVLGHISSRLYLHESDAIFDPNLSTLLNVYMAYFTSNKPSGIKLLARDTIIHVMLR